MGRKQLIRVVSECVFVCGKQCVKRFRLRVTFAHLQIIFDSLCCGEETTKQVVFNGLEGQTVERLTMVDIANSAKMRISLKSFHVLVCGKD